MRSYEVSLEIAGPTAMFTRPDTGATPISYPVPTYSAAKGIFESILRLKSVIVRPVRVEVCSPIVYHRYMTNYGGPLRKGGVLKTGGSYQLAATVLINVCFRLYAEPEPISDGLRDTNNAHAYQEMFRRRLMRGQWHHVPCLGWKEFVPTYAGELRPETTVFKDINLSLPSFLFTVWDAPCKGKYAPSFTQDAKVQDGVLRYAQ
ncbi:MAG: CRISPR-associated protein Cas5 [Candidatus Coatesbacteria bacterium]